MLTEQVVTQTDARECLPEVTQAFELDDSSEVPLLQLTGDETREELFDRVAEHMERLGITEADIEEAVRWVRSHK